MRFSSPTSRVDPWSLFGDSCGETRFDGREPVLLYVVVVFPQKICVLVSGKPR